MNFPTLPTDNLYKFLALSGIVITLVSLVYPASRIESLEISVIEAKAEKEKLVIELAEIERLSGGAGNALPEDDIALRTRLQQIKIKAAELQKLSAISEAELKWVDKYLIVGFIGFLVGPWMALLGFRLWYIRVQKPLDAQIAKQK